MSLVSLPCGSPLRGHVGSPRSGAGFAPGSEGIAPRPGLLTVLDEAAMPIARIIWLATSSIGRRAVEDFYFVVEIASFRGSADAASHP
jgi:hypothetical protein